MQVSAFEPWKSRLQYATANLRGPSGNHEMCVAVRLISPGSLQDKKRQLLVIKCVLMMVQKGLFVNFLWGVYYKERHRPCLWNNKSKERQRL